MTKAYKRVKMNYRFRCGRVAQLGEHLLCKQGVTGSIPVTSTNFFITPRLNSFLAEIKMPPIPFL